MSDKKPVAYSHLNMGKQQISNRSIMLRNGELSSPGQSYNQGFSFYKRNEQFMQYFSFIIYEIQKYGYQLIDLDQLTLSYIDDQEQEVEKAWLFFHINRSGKVLTHIKHQSGKTLNFSYILFFTEQIHSNITKELSL